MKLTPLEIKQKQFQTQFRGLSKLEVEEFLQIVSEEMEDLTRENNENKDKLKVLENQVDEYKDREKTLKETLLTAQKMADDVRQVSEREAKLITSNAELDGEKIIKDAMRRKERLINEIHDLKRQKIQFETTLRGAIEVHMKMLDALQDQDNENDADENLTYFRRKSIEEDERERNMEDKFAAEEK